MANYTYSLSTLFLVLLSVAKPTTLKADDVFQSPEAFIASAFQDSEPKANVLWLKNDLKEGVKKILDHDYSSFRIRYWQHETRTAWILEEIGKVKPITTGIIIQDGKIQSLKVLVYRESHGWEVKHPFFTNQFKKLGLTKSHDLNKKIDGISGATLSVNALKRLSHLALYLDQNVPHETVKVAE